MSRGLERAVCPADYSQIDPGNYTTRTGSMQTEIDSPDYIEYTHWASRSGAERKSSERIGEIYAGTSEGDSKVAQA